MSFYGKQRKQPKAGKSPDSFISFKHRGKRKLPAS
jgi:hypothetical protein